MIAAQPRGVHPNERTARLPACPPASCVCGSAESTAAKAALSRIQAPEQPRQAKNDLQGRQSLAASRTAVALEKRYIATVFAYDGLMRCRWCATDFSGRSHAQYCSTKCRVAAHRAEPPAELRSRDRWLRHDRKRPIQVNGAPASSTNERTWTTYERAHASSVGDGLGFALGDGIACIDLDHCLVDGALADWAEPIVQACRGTYIEVSPSGSGLHIFGLAEVGKGRRRPGVEVYDRDRYMTVTMRRYKRAPLVLRDLSAIVCAI